MKSLIILFVLIFTIQCSISFPIKFLSTKRKFSLYGALNNVPLELSDESANQVIEEIKSELGTLFGYDDGSKAVGITGEIELIEVDGPTIVVSLKGELN